MMPHSFFQSLANPGFSGLFRGLPLPPNQGHDLDCKSFALNRDRQRVVYSAATTSEGFEGFTFAADSMKSEMRGTISDLKREPLNTP
jgi:hypothetical protein